MKWRALGFLLFVAVALRAEEAAFAPPAEFKKHTGKYSSLLRFANGEPVRTGEQWAQRRAEIRQFWTNQLGPWPPLIDRPRIDYLERTNRENFAQHRVRVQIGPEQTALGYLLIPNLKGPRPAVFVPYYEPETSIGASTNKLRDFAYQLARRGFVTLSIGSPGGDARKPDRGEAVCQPLHYLGYVAANCANALAGLPEVDAHRIGVVGHSYGGKWALFAGAFYERFACAAFSDPGIVFDENRPNVNYWEPWYLGMEAGKTRKPGAVTEQNPRTGPYKALYESGHDLHEVLALYAPRPFLVSGGSEDGPERWRPLNRVNEVYALVGVTDRVAMTNRPRHDPSEESNEAIYRFFERFLNNQ